MANQSIDDAKQESISVVSDTQMKYRSTDGEAGRKKKWKGKKSMMQREKW